MQNDTQLQVFDARLAQWLIQRDNLVAQAAEFTEIADDDNDTFERMTSIKTAISRHLKYLSEHRMEITREIDAVKKQIMNREKELAATLTSQLEHLNTLATSYATRMYERKQAAEQARLEAMAEQAQAEELLGEGVEMPTVDVPKMASSTNARMVKEYKYTILDESKIPREFCTVDSKKLNAFIQYHKKLGDIDQITIPGVKIEFQVRVDAK